MAGTPAEYLDTRGMVLPERWATLSVAITDLEVAFKDLPDSPQVFPPGPGLSPDQREGQGPQGAGGRQDPGVARLPPINLEAAEYQRVADVLGMK